jgi:shikimate dehydrogenase
MTDSPVPTPITGKTRIMFILGDPVAHIRGSALFNEHFRQSGLDAACSPLQVAPADLGTIVGAIRKLRNVVGFGVTLPHKIEVVRHLDATTERAAQVGAVNFVRRAADGGLTGDNVDGIGFVAGLARNGIAVKGQRVQQIGAGGAGRSVAFALAEAGASDLRIANRSLEKAQLLAEAVQSAFPRCRCRAGLAEVAAADLVVNTTSVGMHEGDPLPVDIADLPSSAAVADIIMAPETTPLLEQALRRGSRIMRGREMMTDQLRLATAFFAI